MTDQEVQLLPADLAIIILLAPLARHGGQAVRPAAGATRDLQRSPVVGRLP
jgi:hypothetical protein